MSVDVLLHTLNGGDLPEGWSYYSDDGVLAMAPDSFWDQLMNHPEVIMEAKRLERIKNKDMLSKMIIKGSPAAWGINGTFEFGGITFTSYKNGGR